MSKIAGLFVVGQMLCSQMICDQAQAAEKITVFAAASLTEALTEIGQEFEAVTGTEVVFSFAGTGPLARQVEAGAPADVFVSADEAWMDYVRARGAVEPDTIRAVAANNLVLVGAEDAEPLRLNSDEISERLVGNRLAMADPETVPAGRYGRAALEATGLWQGVSSTLAPMDNVRVALASVARGDTALGLVYGSDALVEPRVKVLAVFPEESHPKIRYPAAETVGASEAAAVFMAFLLGAEAQDVFRRSGFAQVK
ncbi:MAG: molybdate ABC transporter substrate-binding protein [Roseibium sp.]|uniref:molybdate ABC transporter substrate-binding protein n=1 Tax=Roseibium sp. TaxID=1936156 RepID=UPI003266372C